MMEDESGGLKSVYRWTVDALFGRSPSAKYVKEQRYAQDDTNYGKGKSYTWLNSRSRSRSNSWSASIPNDRSFYEKYDLLPSIASDHESDQDLTVSPEGRGNNVNHNYDDFNSNDLFDNQEKMKEIFSDKFKGPTRKLLRPVSVVPKGQTHLGRTLYDKEKDNALYRDPTDTFAKRKRNQVPSPANGSGVGNTGFTFQDNTTSNVKVNNRDPLIARLFGKDFESSANKVADLPGKFPSPMKQQTNSRVRGDRFPLKGDNINNFCDNSNDKEYLMKYMDILLSVDKNNELLKSLGDDIESKSKENVVVDMRYKEKYMEMRNELIKELKQSKRAHDNYYVLYKKYKELKTIANEALSMKSTIYQLESEILEQNVSKNREIQDLNEKVLSLEKNFTDLQTSKEIERERYELRIAALEAQLQDQLRDKNYFSDHSYSHRSREFSPIYNSGNYFSEDISDNDPGYPYKNMYK